MVYKWNPFTTRMDMTVSSAYLDANYLRLDCSNSPLTGNLKQNVTNSVNSPAFWVNYVENSTDYFGGDITAIQSILNPTTILDSTLDATVHFNGFFGSTDLTGMTVPSFPNHIITAVGLGASTRGVFCPANSDETIYGTSSVAFGDLGTVGNTIHYGGSYNAAGTARLNAGLVVSASGATKNYGLYVAVADLNRLGGDNTKSVFGFLESASMYYDGTNFVINPKEAGTGLLDVLGTGRFTNIIDTGLSGSLGVYTDANKQLTSTPPTSGILGYWSRTGTTLTPSNSGDNVTTTGVGTFGNLQVTGQNNTTVTSPNPTGAITGVIAYAPTYFTYPSYYLNDFAIRAYTYKVVSGVKVFSTTYLQSPTLNADGSDDFGIEWTLPTLPAGATGWRVLFYSVDLTYNYDYYFDTTNSAVNDGGITWTAGNTVTPTSGTVYGGTSLVNENLTVNGALIVGNGAAITGQTSTGNLLLGDNTLHTTPGIKFIGMDAFGNGSTSVGGLSLFLGFNGGGTNDQLWIGYEANLGDSTKNFFRYWIYQGTPMVSGVNGTNAVNVPISVGAFSKTYIGDFQDDGTNFTCQVAGSLSVATNVYLNKTSGTTGVGCTGQNYARLTLWSGSTLFAPLVITSGALKTTVQDGAVEYLNTAPGDFYFTTNDGGTKTRHKSLLTAGVTSLTSGRIPFATTNGRVTDSSNLTFNSVTNTLSTSNISVNGLSTSALVYGATTVSGATYNIASSDMVIWATGTIDQTFTLPAATTPNIGRVYYIKKIASGGILTINTTSSQTIDGDLTKQLNIYDCIQLMSDGSNWWIM